MLEEVRSYGSLLLVVCMGIVTKNIDDNKGSRYCDCNHTPQHFFLHAFQQGLLMIFSCCLLEGKRAGCKDITFETLSKKLTGNRELMTNRSSDINVTSVIMQSYLDNLLYI